jgi:hypothetical protein
LIFLAHDQMRGDLINRHPSAWMFTKQPESWEAVEIGKTSKKLEQELEQHIEFQKLAMGKIRQTSHQFSQRGFPYKLMSNVLKGKSTLKDYAAKAPLLFKITADLADYNSVARLLGVHGTLLALVFELPRKGKNFVRMLHEITESDFQQQET